MRTIAAALSLVLLGCSTHAARYHCEGLLCHYVEEIEDCPAVQDGSILECTEKRIEYYQTVAGFFAGIIDGIVEGFAALAAAGKAVAS